MKELVAQSCPTLCNLMDCGPPDSSVHVIFQAKVLEWIAISFSRGSSPARDQTQVSCIASRVFTVWLGQTLAIRKNPQSIKPSVYFKSPDFHSDKTFGITHFSTFMLQLRNRGSEERDDGRAPASSHQQDGSHLDEVAIWVKIMI